MADALDLARQLVAHPFDPSVAAETRQSVAELLTHIGELDVDGDVQYVIELAAALDFLGMQELAYDLLRAALHVAKEADTTMRIRNSIGRLDDATGADTSLSNFENSIIEAGKVGSPRLASIQANLATAAFKAGNIDRATRYVKIVEDKLNKNDSGPIELRIAVTYLKARMALGADDVRELDQEAKALRAALATLVEEKGDLNAVVVGWGCRLAALELRLAVLNKTFPRAKLASGRLRILFQHLSSLTGLTDRNTCAIYTEMANCEYDLARILGSPRERLNAIALLRDAHSRLVELLGNSHPTVLLAAANLALADIETARFGKNVEALRRSVEVLARSVSRVADSCGSAHPTAMALLVNLATAEFELARLDTSREQIMQSIGVVEIAVSRISSQLGQSHPAALVLSRVLRGCEQLAQDHDGFGGGGGVVALRVKAPATNPFDFGDDYVSYEDAVRALSGRNSSFGSLSRNRPGYPGNLPYLGLAVRETPLGWLIDVGDGTRGCLSKGRGKASEATFKTGEWVQGYTSAPDDFMDLKVEWGAALSEGVTAIEGMPLYLSSAVSSSYSPEMLNVIWREDACLPALLDPSTIARLTRHPAYQGLAPFAESELFDPVSISIGAAATINFGELLRSFAGLPSPARKSFEALTASDSKELGAFIAVRITLVNRFPHSIQVKLHNSDIVSPDKALPVELVPIAMTNGRWGQVQLGLLPVVVSNFRLHTLPELIDRSMPYSRLLSEVIARLSSLGYRGLVTISWLLASPAGDPTRTRLWIIRQHPDYSLSDIGSLLDAEIEW